MLPCSYASTTLGTLPTSPTFTTMLDFATARLPQHP